MNLDYWTKISKNQFEDIYWNVPEQKTGIIGIIGGNAQNFSPEIKTAELISTFNIREMRLLLPDALAKKVPPVPGINFSKSTESGSFDKSPELNFAIKDADITLLNGDFSKNSKTTIAISDAIKNSPRPIILVRDSIEAVTEEAENLMERDNLVLVASMAQLQKLFRSLLYPKMLMLSEPLLPVIETLHKFTISYHMTILTYHQEKIITAKDGKVYTAQIEDTNYSPLSLFVGDLAAKITALNLWNPQKTLDATAAAIFWNPNAK